MKKFNLFNHNHHKLMIPAMLYHFGKLAKFPQVNVHLRVEKEGNSTLIINGNIVLHLNATATTMAYYYLNNFDEKNALKKLADHYHEKYPVLEKDYRQLINSIESILNNGHVCFCEIDNIDTEYPFQRIPTAPYRMDLALTYACNNDCYHCYNEPGRSLHSLSVIQWKDVIDKLLEIGIPHIVFTGGEPTLYNGLTELIAYASGKGLITGLNTNGRRLSDKQFVQSLVDAGLDHVQITLESAHPEIHNYIVHHPSAWEETNAGIINALTQNLFVMTNTTLLRENSSTLIDTLEYLSKLGVPTVGINALIFSGKGKAINNILSEDELFSLLEMAQEFVRNSGQKLIWYTPTAYCHFDPMSLDLGVKGCTAALYNMCIEPNGDVLPCQSYYSNVGNILKNNWNDIWEHPLCISLRNRAYLNDECKSCILQKECGGGCPLAPLQPNQPHIYRMPI
ncbi:MAG: radical SAM protein [Anaerolineales bacterium]